MSTKKKIFTGLAICVAIGLAGTVMMGMASPGGGGMGGRSGAGGNAESEQASRKTIVEISTAQIGSIHVTGSYVGSVEPGQQVTVYPKASGEVVTANFSVGDTVEAGDVLFELDSTSLQLDIAQQQANLSSKQASAQLQLEQAQNNLDNYNGNIEDGYNQTLVTAENNVVKMEVALQLANVNLRSARNDYNNAKDEDAEDSVLDSLRDIRVQREIAVEQAQVNLEQAEQALELAKKQVSEQTQTTEYSVKSAELSNNFTADNLSIQKLQKTLADYTVTAPISGVIEQKNLDVYDMASTQSVAYVISNKEAALVSFQVSEAALAYIQMGDRVTVEKDNRTCSGAVTEIASMASSNGLYIIKTTMENTPFELRSNSTVKVLADTQKVENEMLIPIDSVYYDNGTPYVYVFESNTAKKVEIETGITDDENVHVVSGLSLSDEIIVTWSASLYDGAEVYLPGTVPQEPAPDGSELTEDSTQNEANESNADEPETNGQSIMEKTEESGEEASQGEAEEEAA